MTETALNPLTGWENDMKSIKVIETDLNGAFELLRARKTVYANSECTLNVNDLQIDLTEVANFNHRTFYYKLECEKREYVGQVTEFNTYNQIIITLPDDTPKDAICYITVEIPINATPAPKV